MVFPSLSPFAGPLLGGSQPTNAEPPRDRGRGSPSWLNCLGVRVSFKDGAIPHHAVPG